MPTQQSSDRIASLRQVLRDAAGKGASTLNGEPAIELNLWSGEYDGRYVNGRQSLITTALVLFDISLPVGRCQAQ